MNKLPVFVLAVVVMVLAIDVLKEPEATLLGVGFRPIRSGSFDTEIAKKSVEDELVRVKAHRSTAESALELTVIANWKYDNRGDPKNLRIELLCACPERFVHARGFASGISRLGWFSKHDETLATIAARAAVHDLARQLRTRSRKKGQPFASAQHRLGAGPFLFQSGRKT